MSVNLNSTLEVTAIEQELEMKRRRCHDYVAHLPPDLIEVVVAQWNWCDDLQFVLTLRTLNRAFAEALRHRVYTHAPDIQVFYRELQLMRTFHLTQRRQAAGSQLYYKAFYMIWRRYHEKHPKQIVGFERQRLWYQELCLWVQARIELMPAGWGPWVGRLHHANFRSVFDMLMVTTLDVTFQRMYDGERIGGDRDPRRDESLLALIAAARACLHVADGNRDAAMVMFNRRLERDGVPFGRLERERAMDKAVRQRNTTDAA